MYKREKTAEEWLLIQIEQRRWQIAVDLLLIQPTAGYEQCAREKHAAASQDQSRLCHFSAAGKIKAVNTPSSLARASLSITDTHQVIHAQKEGFNASVALAIPAGCDAQVNPHKLREEL